MKRTNSLLSSFWVKVVPVFLLLVCIGFTNARAQNYKPLGEAISSVKTAHDALTAKKGSPQISQSGSTTQIGGHSSNHGLTSLVDVFEISYYERFVELAQENNSVSAAFEALNAQFPPSADQTRNSILSKGKSDLIDLITY